jgi:hypothetical protein
MNFKNNLLLILLATSGSASAMYPNPYYQPTVYIPVYTSPAPYTPYPTYTYYPNTTHAYYYPDYYPYYYNDVDSISFGKKMAFFSILTAAFLMIGAVLNS